jgi:methionyl-tRNA formyltransferase
VNKYILISEKKWHQTLFNKLKKLFPNDSWLLIDDKNDFNLLKLEAFCPTKIFIPHWSHIIPSEIFESYDCIVFHMTDLPFGRGGSPLQNLISRGYKTTKISALKVEDGIDTGEIYLKKTLDLEGTATQIFEKSSSIIEDMIQEIIEKNISPFPQVGEITKFKRRTPEESNIINLSDLEKIYDHIRMLDCDGYPHAFIDTPHFKIEFTNANLDTNEKIISAHVRIIKK